MKDDSGPPPKDTTPNYDHLPPYAPDELEEPAPPEDGGRPNPPDTIAPDDGAKPALKSGDATPTDKGGAPESGTEPNCIELAIQELTGIITEGDKAKSSKTELEQLLPKATKAAQDYSEIAYDALLIRWKALDEALAKELLPKFHCTIGNWRWLLEWRVCPLLANIKALDGQLVGTCAPTQPQACEGLYDKKHRLTQELARLTRNIEWRKDKLAAWEKPADTLKALLDANEALKNKVGDNIGKSDARAYVWDVWMKLLPLHFMMGPRNASGRVVSLIDQKFRYCCASDRRDPNDPTAPTVLERLLKPQPRLIPPSDYFSKVLCPLIADHTKAKTAASEKAGEIEKVTAEIKSTEAKLTESKTTFEASAKAKLLKKLPANAPPPYSTDGTQTQPPPKPADEGKPDARQAAEPKPPTPADPKSPNNPEPPRVGQ